MRAVTQDFARSANGIRNLFHAAHASGTKRSAVHNQRIELNLAIAIEEAATASVKRLVVLHDDDRFLYGIQCRSATLEHTPASGNCSPHAAQMCLYHVIRNGPGAAVDEQNGIRRQRIPRSIDVESNRTV